MSYNVCRCCAGTHPIRRQVEAAESFQALLARLWLVRCAPASAFLVDAELRPPTPSPQIMAMAALLRQFTVDEVEAFPDDGNRYEVLHGVLLVTPQAGFSHQVIAMRVAASLYSLLQDEAGIQVCAPGAVQIRPSIHLEPDVLVGGWPEVPRWDAVVRHWLAVEVSGVGSRVQDREYKRDAYLRLGVQEVWLVDLDLQHIFVSRPGGRKDVSYDSTLTWVSPGGRELRLDIPALFRGVAKTEG